jgi:hypothetical protein
MARELGPVQTKSGAVPANHGFGSDHQEGLLPSGPTLAHEQPEQLIQRTELGSRALGRLRHIFRQEGPDVGIDQLRLRVVKAAVLAPGNGY